MNTITELATEMCAEARTRMQTTGCSVETAFAVAGGESLVANPDARNWTNWALVPDVRREANRLAVAMFNQ